LRILVAHNHYQQPGGEDESFAAEVAALRGAGHEVTTYAVHNDTIRGMKKVDVALRTLWNRRSYAEVRKLIRRHRPDVCHFQNTFPLISPSAYYAARAERVPVVQHLRNYRLLCPGALFFRDGKVCEDCLHKCIPLPGILHKCYRGSLAGSATVAAMLTLHRGLRTWDRLVDVYVSLTEFAKRKFVQGGFDAGRIVVKPNFVTPDPGPGAGDGNYAVFLGRLSHEKGVTTMLRAWEQYGLGASLPLKVIGSGPSEDEVKAAAARGPGIEHLGRMPARQAYDVVGRASMLVLPSEWYETFGRVAVEAFAKGTPVVASDLGAMAELVDHGRTGLLFRPGDPADLAARVRQLLADPQRLAAMRGEVRREFDAKYTAAHNVRQLVQIYERAIRSRPADSTGVTDFEAESASDGSAAPSGLSLPVLPANFPLAPSHAPAPRQIPA
jgi:glycosyltransferase involved in cell wall biosynthesis